MTGGFFSGAKPRVFGHRGAMGEFPENTLLSFERALEQGATCLETDVHASRDGHPVLFHDETLERTTNGSGFLREHTLRELKALDAGWRFTADGGATYPFRGRGLRIPTLEEFFSRFPGVKTTLEIKQSDPSVENLILELARRLDRLGDILLASERDVIMKRILDSGVRVATSFSAAEVVALLQSASSVDSAPQGPPDRALQVPERWGGVQVVSAGLVEAAHARGLEVHVWTVNQTADMEHLLRLGVDGIVTDFPARLAALLRSRRPEDAAPVSSFEQE